MKEIAMICIGAAAGLLMAAITQVDDPKVMTHVSADANIVCMTYKQQMQCFPYTDEGSHLHVQPTQPKLAL